MNFPGNEDDLAEQEADKSVTRWAVALSLAVLLLASASWFILK
jgi:hypothetical protein